MECMSSAVYVVIDGIRSEYRYEDYFKGEEEEEEEDYSACHAWLSVR